MFKLFLSITFLMLSSLAFAQYSINPVTYTPIEQTLSMPNESFSLPYDDYYFPHSKRNNSVKVTDKTTIKATAYELESSKLYEVQITVTEYSNGNINLKCCGIKENDKWTPISAEVSSLQEIYDSINSTDTEAKSTILSLMEFSDFIMLHNNRTFLVGGK